MTSHIEQGLKRPGIPQQRGKLQRTGGYDQGKKTPIVLKIVYVVASAATITALLWLGARQLAKQGPEGVDVPPPIQTPIGFTPNPTEKPVLTPSPTIEPTPYPTATVTPSPSPTVDISQICEWPEDLYSADFLDHTNVINFKFNDEEAFAYIYSGASDDNGNPTFGEAFSGKAFIVSKTKGNDTIFVLYEDNIKGKFEFIEMLRLDDYLREIGRDPVEEFRKIRTYGDLANLYINTVPEDKRFKMPPFENTNAMGNSATTISGDEVESAEAKMLRTALLNKWLDNEFDSYRQANPEVHKERVKGILV